MSRLSLQSAQGSSRGNHLRGRAQGIAGLTSRGGRGGGGGRAGLAKRNLASLAPGGLPGVPVTTERAFGPQAGDVGTRSTRGEPAVQPLSESTDAKTAVKPKSKLALLAEKKRSAAAGSHQSTQTNPISEAPKSSPSKRASETNLQASQNPNQSNTLNPGQQISEAASSPRPSKLMALAQGKKGSANNANSTSPRSDETSKPIPPLQNSSSSAEPNATSKPLSKLQQRALAARQEREEKQRLAARASASKGQSASGTAEQMDVDIAMPDDGRPSPTPRILPGGLSEKSLFPMTGGQQSGTGSSSMGETLSHSVGLQAGGGKELSWLGSAPENGEIRQAFLGPSPDDKVLNARQGTSLRN